MAGVNKVLILGRLGRTPETTFTPGGMAVCKFSMATSRKDKQGNEETQWHRFVSFGKAAELIQQYVKKGDQLYVEGELKYGSYEKDGVTRYTTDIIVREFNFVGGGGQQQGGTQGGQQNSRQNNGYQGQQNRQPQGGGYQGNPGGQPQGSPDDDLLF